MLNIGFNHYIPIGMITSILDATSSSSLKKFIEKKKESNEFISTASGRKMLSLILTADGSVYSSAVGSNTLQDRYRRLR